MERLGYIKDQDWHEFKIYIPDGVPDKHLRIGEIVKKKYGLKIYSINDALPRFYADKNFTNVGPKDFIGLIYNCSLFLSNSFHGTAFSLIFHKNFNTYIAVPKSSQRIKSLLETCGLHDRIISSGANAIFADNYTESFNEQAFAEYRQSSLLYLNEIFG